MAVKTREQLRTDRADAVEKARAAKEAIDAKRRDDPTLWTDAEHETINKLVEAADNLDKEYKDLAKKYSANDRLGELEDTMDRKEDRRTDRRDLDKGSGNRGNVITWSGASKKTMRSYAMQGGKLSQPEYDDAFSAYVGGNDTKMLELQQVRNAATGMSSDLEEKGGYFITPETWATEIIKLVDDEVFVQSLSRVIMLPNGNRSFSARCRKQRASTFRWAGENDDTTNTIDQSLLYGKRSLTPNYIEGSCVISRDLLRNVPSAEAMVMDEIAIDMSYKLEPAFIGGDGNQKPLGLMVNSVNGIGSTRDVTAGGLNFTFDDFVNQKYSLKLKYRNKAQWMLHRTVLNATALLKDGNGQYLWQPSRQVGEPDRILGLGVTETEWMPNAVSAGMYYSLLGDFSWYWIVYELSMEMQRLIEMRARTNENEYLFRAKLDAAPMLEEAFVRGKRGST